MAEQSESDRVGTLIERAKERSNQYWRIGPGQPQSLPVLNEAIDAADEAYGCFTDGDPWRRMMASMCGALRGARHLGHGSPVEDRELAVTRLEEGLGLPQLPTAQQMLCRITLGQLLIARLTRALSGVDLAGINAGLALPPDAEAVLDRAADRFRQVVGTAAIPVEARNVATALIRVTDAFRMIVVALQGREVGLTTMDNLVAAMKVIQEFHEQHSAQAGLPFGSDVIPMFNGDRLAETNPLDRPAVMVDVEPPEPVAPSPAFASVDTDQVVAQRARLRERIADGRELFTALEALLDPAVWPTVDRIDEIVALGIAVVDSGAANRTDRLLLAAGLTLRAGRTGPEANRRDVDEAADHLLQAVNPGRPAASETTRVMRALALRLDQLHPGIGVAGRLTKAMTPVTGGHRRRLPIGDSAVFVVDPRGDRAGLAVEALVLRRTFYPRSTGLGRTIENIDGPGTPAEVVKRLTASMLYLGCGITADGALELADSALLSPDRITAAGPSDRRAGGLAVLPADATGPRVQRLTDALLTAGFAGVISWRHQVPAGLAALIEFVLHSRLVDGRLALAEAVDEVGRWLADPARKTPAYLPAEYDAAMGRADLSQEPYLTALSYRAAN